MSRFQKINDCNGDRVGDIGSRKAGASARRSSNRTGRSLAMYESLCNRLGHTQLMGAAQDRVYNEDSEGMPFCIASFTCRSIADRAINDLNGKEK